MDDDSCGKFIGSLTKYLQSLCHSYVDFDRGVELVGHIYLNVDTGKKIDYVLNESVCKNGANVVKFTSNSYHAQPVEKQKKDTPKKATDPPKSSTDSRKKNDDDDVIIVGSEGSRRNRAGSSPSRSHGGPVPMQRGAAGGPRGMVQSQGGMFRHPRGPNPRIAGPMPRGGAYTYQPRQRLSYPQQPRGYMNIGAGYNPRMRQPMYPGPRGAQPMGVRGSNPVDTDVTFMREEYVAGQPSSRALTQPVAAGAQQAGYGYPRQVAPLPMQAGQHLGQRYPAPYPQDSTAPPTSTAQPATMAGPHTSGVVATTDQPGQDGAAQGQGHIAATTTTAPSMFDQSQSGEQSTSGGMPLPVTTHTMFSSPDTLGSDLPSTAAPSSSAASVSMDSAAITSVGAVTSSASQPSLLIGQVWSQSGADSNPNPSQAQPVSGAGGLPYPAPNPAPGLSQGGPDTARDSAPATDSAPNGAGSSVFDIFNQHPPAPTQQTNPSDSPPLPPGPFSPSYSAGGGAPASSHGSDGDRFSALVSELQAFNQHAANNQQPPTTATSSEPGYPAAAQSPGSERPDTSLSVTLASEPGVKRDPGEIGANIAAAVLQESTEAAANEAGETFLAPLGMGGGGEGGRKRSSSASSQSRGTPSPNATNLVGPESVVIETKPFLQHTSDYDSGCDSASASTTGERLASPQGPLAASSHSQVRPFSIPLVPVDSPTSSTKSVDVKRERLSEEEEAEMTLKTPNSQWTGAADSEWIKDMSILNNSDDSMDSATDDDVQDDDDPSYTPGRPINQDKGAGKRARGKQSEKGNRGKKRKTDTADSEEAGEEHSNQNMEASPEAPDAEKEEEGAPFPETEEAQEDSEGQSLYKPGTFILINFSKESERSSRIKSHTPAEVIARPDGAHEGVWVHVLIPAGAGLWRLPSVDQIIETQVDPSDIIRILEKANVRITGTRVFYKFDDM